MLQPIVTPVKTFRVYFMAALLGLGTITIPAATPPAILSVAPLPGNVTTLTTITVTFGEAVANIVRTDLLVNGQPCETVNGGGAVYTFTLASQPDYGIVQIGWDPAHSITDLDEPANRFDGNGTGATWQYDLIDTTAPAVASLAPAAGISVRSLKQVEVSFSEAVTGVEAGDLLINGSPASGLSVLGVGKYRFTFPQPASGTVSVNWAANHGIRDFASVPNSFVGDSWTYTLDPNLGLPNLRINEFLAANLSGLVDEDTPPEPQDWIEIWNYGTSTVNLNGFALTDDSADPGKWTFPSTNLAPGQFIIVFASEKNRRTITNAAHRFHTNFKLNPGGEYLALFNAESPRVAITEFAPEYPEQRNNYSYGFDSSGALKYFATPTPGAANGSSAIASILAPPHFNVERGLFDQPFTLILSTTEAGASIRYTTDGSEPTATNALYSGSLNITNTTVLRAAAFRANTLPSVTVTHTYLFLEQVVQQPGNPAGFPTNWGCCGNINDVSATATFPPASTVPGVVPADYAMDMDPLRVDPNNTNSPIDAVKLQRLKDGLREIPTVSIVMKTDDIFGITGLYQRSADETGSTGTKPDNKKLCSVEMILPDGATAFTTTCGIDLHGNASRNPIKNPKHGFKLKFKGDYGPSSLQHRLFEDSPVEEYDDILLRADFNSSWRHWSDTAGQGLGAFQRTRATRTRDAWMKDSMRGMGGLASHSRFCHLYLNGLYWGVYDLSEDPTESFGKTALGGTEADYDIVDQGVIKNGTGTAYNAMLALPAAATLPQFEAYHQYLNMPEFIDYMLLHFFMGHQDWATSVTKNWAALRKRVPGVEGTFRYMPWDGECILLNEDVNRVTVTTPPSGLHTKLDDSPEYRLAFADRTHRSMVAPGGALTPAANIARWQKWQAVLDKAIVAESARWGDYRRDVHQSSEGVYQLYTRENHWLAENTRMLGYFANRNATVLTQLRNAGMYPTVSAASFNQQGGPIANGFNLTMTATNAVYYTLDGSDPRVYGTGVVAPDAILYSGAIALTNSVTVKARALFGAEWSALNEAVFTVDALGSPLRLTEIMYQPPGGDAYEFVELQNVSGTAVNFGYYSIDGLGYVFPPGTVLAPGQIIVLRSSDSAANWTNRYPGVTAFGFFDGKLDNGGEKLALHDAAGRLLWSVDYEDENGWPLAADGSGASLEIIDPFGDPDDAANWRASAAANGTPGTLTPPPAPGSVVLNEVMAENLSAVNNGGFHSDWVELRNTSGASVSLANWSLTDDSNARKFVFPAHAAIPANDYLVIWCDTNALVPGLRAPFGLGRNGDTVILYDASTNRVDAIGFGLQLADRSIGRIGGFWQLTESTPNTVNVAAAVAATTNLVINEWLANAAPGADDWVELYNRDLTAPVALRGIYLGVSNALQKLSALSFIPAGGYVQLLADEGSGANHLDFKLPAAGGAIALFDETSVELDRVIYGPQAQSVSQGRLPDGAANVSAFVNSQSPAAGNYLLTYAGPRLHEVLAFNRAAATNAAGRTADFVELRNTNAAPFDASGMRLSTDPENASQWTFPTGSLIPANGHLVVWFDDERAASPVFSPVLNAGRSLNSESDQVWLFDAAGVPVDSVVFGFQVADLPLGRSSNGWDLLAFASPGAANASAATLGSASGLRINEWMASPTSGNDWFELFNIGGQPVALAGLLLADHPMINGAFQTVVAPLSFIGANGFVKFIADDDVNQGGHHVNFNLDELGEALRLSSTALGVIDSVYFGAQSPGVSQGRLPDGAANIVGFPTTATPAESNYLPIPNAVLNEILTHTDAPLEDAVEIFNPTGAAVDIGGWFLSDSAANFQKFRIATGTMLPAFGFQVIYQNQLDGGTGSLAPFTFDSANGEEVWLSASDGGGQLTGYRTPANFGAAANGVSFGRFATTQGIDYPAASRRTFGVDAPATLTEFRTGTGRTNAAPLVGPVVLNEIMYHPPELGGTNDNTADEYVELHNVTTNAVPLYDPAAPTNSWRLRGGVEFNLPPNTTIAARAFLLVVSFDPSDAPALAAFRAKYSLSAGVPVVGPYTGKLDNGGERLTLEKPDGPQGPGPNQGFVPYVLEDAVDYGDVDPWPLEPDGAGASLQRRRPSDYANDPVNWKSGAPTPGRANVPGGAYTDADADGMADDWELAHGLNPANPGDAALDADGDGVGNGDEFLAGTDPQISTSLLVAPVITGQPLDQAGILGFNLTLNASATGTAPLGYQWWFNGHPIAGAIASTLTRTNAQLSDAGTYHVVVINDAGYAVSQPARVTLNLPPAITSHPVSLSVAQGGNATNRVTATGTGVLRYQWQLNGGDVPGATNATLIITNAQIENEGDYTALVTDDIATVSSAVARLTVRVPPTFVIRPIGQTNVAGSTMTFTVTTAGSLPMGYEWRRGSVPVTNMVLLTNFAAFTIFNAQPANSATYRLVLTNSGNPSPIVNAQFVVLVVAPPIITNQPVSRMVNVGTNVSFTVTAGTTLLRYQWYFNDALVPNATNATLSLTNVQPASQGGYFVVVTNLAGSITSVVANLSFLGGPSITSHPQSQDVVAGSNAVFSIVASGDGLLGYQWRFNEGRLPGETGTTLTLTNVQASHAGLYSVVVSNIIGSATSQPAQLAVVIQPVLSEVEVLTNGLARFNILGNTNRTYHVEVSTNLTDWSTLTSLLYTNGPLPYTDTTSPGVTNRFYRLRLVPNP